MVSKPYPKSLTFAQVQEWCADHNLMLIGSDTTITAGWVGHTFVARDCAIQYMSEHVCDQRCRHAG